MGIVLVPSIQIRSSRMTVSMGTERDPYKEVIYESDVSCCMAWGR